MDSSFFGPSVDVAIGLVFVFLLFSLLLSTVMETIATVLRLRARALENAIARLIEHPPRSTPTGIAAFLPKFTAIFGRDTKAVRRARPAAPPAASGSFAPLTFEAVYCHPLVAGLNGRNRPSYVPAENFALALLFALRRPASGHGGLDASLPSIVERSVAALPTGDLREALTTVIEDAQSDYPRIKRGLESWYNEAMDRLSGDYKRFTQTCTFVLGLMIAAIANINSVDIVERLYAEPALRSHLADEAQTYLRRHPPGQEAALPGGGAGSSAVAVDDRLREEIAGMAKARRLLMQNTPMAGWRTVPAGWEWLVTLAGWTVTALAGMLGAHFWFDLLQKLVNLRGTGPKPVAKAPDPDSA
jgi:hypothetical protein